MSDPLPALRRMEDPSLQYRLITEYDGVRLSSKEKRDWQKRIFESQAVQSIIKKMHPDHYWLQTNRRTKEVLGAGVQYGSYATTHFCLAYLSELGLDKSNPLIKQAADRYLKLQKSTGDWWLNLSCLNAYNIRTYVRLGYRKNRRIQKSIDMLLNIERDDGGYLCDLHVDKYKTKQAKSCIRGAAKVLLAFAELPEYHQHPRIQALLDYFLDREVVFRSDKKDLAQKDFKVLSYPIAWGTNIWEVLYALSRMGYAGDKRLQKAWHLLEQRRNPDGFLPLDATPAECPWKVGQRGQPNYWITYYIELARKQADH